MNMNDGKVGPNSHVKMLNESAIEIMAVCCHFSLLLTHHPTSYFWCSKRNLVLHSTRWCHCQFNGTRERKMASTMEDVLTQEVNAVEKLLSNGINHLQVQDKYILPPSERPQLSEVSYSQSIPVVDLQDLDGPNRAEVVHKIQHALEEDGCFQIVNHGVPEVTMKSMMEIAKEFFEMPVEERACLYSENPSQQVRLATSIFAKKKSLTGGII